LTEPINLNKARKERARDVAKATYRAVEAKAAPLTPAWQQQVDRIAQKTLSQRRIGPPASAPPRAPALP